MKAGSKAESKLIVAKNKAGKGGGEGRESDQWKKEEPGGRVGGAARKIYKKSYLNKVERGSGRGKEKVIGKKGITIGYKNYATISSKLSSPAATGCKSSLDSWNFFMTTSIFLETSGV